MFDESLNPSTNVDLQAPEVIAPIPEAIAPENTASTGSVDPTLFIRREGNELILVQIYVDDIIFAASTPERQKEARRKLIQIQSQNRSLPLPQQK
ncbi:hypothetical protein Tco_0310964, partial [Tanacetum coccineum]